MSGWLVGCLDFALEYFFILSVSFITLKHFLLICCLLNKMYLYVLHDGLRKKTVGKYLLQGGRGLLGSVFFKNCLGQKEAMSGRGGLKPHRAVSVPGYVSQQL